MRSTEQGQYCGPDARLKGSGERKREGNTVCLRTHLCDVGTAACLHNKETARTLEQAREQSPPSTPPAETRLCFVLF